MSFYPLPPHEIPLTADTILADIWASEFLDGAIFEGIPSESIDQMLLDAQYQQYANGASTLLLTSENYVTVVGVNLVSTLATDDNVIAGQVTWLNVRRNDGSIPAGNASALRAEADAENTPLPSIGDLIGPLDRVLSVSRADFPIQDLKTALLMNTPGSGIFDPQQGYDHISEALFGKSVFLNVVSTEGGQPVSVKTFGGRDRISVFESDQIFTIDTGDGDDYILGHDDADVFIGGAGNDYFEGGGGADTVEGGLGDDFMKSLTFNNAAEVSAAPPWAPDVQTPDNVFTLIYDDIAGGATIQFERGNWRDRWTISDRDGETFGTDTVEGMAHVAFTDFEWHAFDAQAVLYTPVADISALIEMYIAHFDRAPDALGLHFWAAQLANGVPMEEIAPLFEASQEAQTFGLDMLSDGDFIEEMYLNVLGRASDAAGRTFWEGVLTDGSIERADFTLHLLEGAHSDVEAGAAQSVIDQKAADVSYLQAKTDIGAYFSLIGGLNNTEWGAAALDLIDGTEAGTQAAKEYVDARITEAHTADSGEFVVSILGVIDDPFAVA